MKSRVSANVIRKRHTHRSVYSLQAFYVPETEFLHWARTHPEYSKAQIVAMVNLVATMNNWKRKTRVDLVEKIESGDMG
jgi:hypothetical protein